MHSNKLSGKIGFGFTVSVLGLFYQFSLDTPTSQFTERWT